ncbi:uncharacterized protein LOC114735542 [Neltuma alba]|uniref:uncharacterized protein LOC114735542 n=1 Tax=Neltuma alba TaxID=207710 RepID=UPI0010A40E36|nr:uncharacterized protein LOC114735542 [Prosopis alba]
MSATNEYTQPHVSATGYLDDGDPVYECQFCGALLWIGERLKRCSSSEYPLFSTCCCHGKVVVPYLQTPPEQFRQLFFQKEHPKSKNFLANIRAYNNMFCFTSMGGKIDHSLNSRGGGPYSFIMSGQNYHLLGSLLPPEGCPPVYSQLYIYDTDNEIRNRMAAIRHHPDKSGVDEAIAMDIKDCLDQHNALVKKYRMASEILRQDNTAEVRIRLLRESTNRSRNYELPTASEVAALIVEDFDESYSNRDIIIEKKAGSLKRVHELHRSYLPLQYPLIFHYGNNGFIPKTKHNDASLISTRKKKYLTIREYLAFRLMDRNIEESVLLHSKRLLQQFIVDGFTMVESERLDYIRRHQRELRVDLYKGLADAITRGETDASNTGKRIILPSSFTGGARYMIHNYRDAMAICRWAGYPDIFLTFTCNPAWPEITRFCKKYNLSPSDRPDILTRMFNLKLAALMKCIKEQKIFGTIKAEIYTIEFQKRGLPHAHIILFIEPCDKPKTAEDVDRIISAEIPDKDADPVLFELVTNFMMHGPCGCSNQKSPCMKDGKCSKYFPRRYAPHTTIDDDGYPTYRRRNNGRTTVKRGIQLDNRYVVPYNAQLLRLFQGHLNVEKTNQSRAIKYLFKYISKGHDRVIAGIYHNDEPGTSRPDFDEISHYLNCRYISACEGTWRIFSFNIHHRYPSVERLSFHLPDQQAVFYTANDEMPSLIDRPRKREWRLRQRGFSVGRLAHVSPSQGEAYYLRVLLTKTRGPFSYKDIRTVDNVVQPTFRAACYALGLLHDDQEYINAVKEAAFWATEISITDSDREEAGLIEIQRLLLKNGRSLDDYPSLPKPSSTEFLDTTNNLLLQELSYDRDACAADAVRLAASLTDEQRKIFHEVLDAVSRNTGGFYFIYGYGGTGKTFLWNALTVAVRANGGVVINVASSGIAATLLPSGRTAHSRFAIPIDINEDSTCNISHGSPVSHLLRSAKLIIWDEAPMIKRHCVEAVDRSLKDIMRCDLPFGGKCIVMGGDFRQILPVMPKGFRTDIINAAINSSALWPACKLFRLTKNMRLQLASEAVDQKKVSGFSRWLLDVGDGTIGLPHEGMTDIEIPADFLITDSLDPINSIVSSTYPALQQNITHPNYLTERAILAPTTDVVDKINDYMLSLLPGDSVHYLSSDSISSTDQDSSSFQDLYSPEFLNTINCSGCHPISSL